MTTSRIKTILQSVSIATASFALPLTASAQTFADRIRVGVTGAAQGSGLDKSPNLTTIIGNTINVALSFVGIVMFVYFLYAGFLYLTSAGDKEKVGTAEKIMRTTIIGLAIVVGAYALSNTVLDLILNNVLKG